MVTVLEEKDLGVIIDEHLKFHEHTHNKGNHTIGIIRKTFTNLSSDTFLNLYKSLLRLQLKYGNGIWSPFCSVDQTKV